MSNIFPLKVFVVLLQCIALAQAFYIMLENFVKSMQANSNIDLFDLFEELDALTMRIILHAMGNSAQILVLQAKSFIKNQMVVYEKFNFSLKTIN